MAEDKITPEEKLLKVIENPVNVKVKPLLTIKEGLCGRAFLKKWLPRATISLKNTHKVLAISSIVITVIGGGTFIKGHNDFNGRLKNIMAGPQDNFKEEKERHLLSVNLTEAVSDAGRRNVFISLPAKPENAAAKAVEQTISNLKLVGILWSAKPQVMIEDVSVNKTFLLGVDEVAGDFKVKKILRDKVIIGKGDQQWELR